MMDLTVKKGSLGYFLWMLVALLLCLCGSNGHETEFTIFRSKRDIFTNLECTSDSCDQSQCGYYGAECFSYENCEYCRCLDGINTFMISKDESEGKCVSDENIVAKSGCNRFSDDSFMAYLNYSDNNHKFRISAPIFDEQDDKCKVKKKFKFTEDGLKWKTSKPARSLFSIHRITNNIKELKINRKVNLKAWNGTLVKLYVDCGDEKHCVLFKLQSWPEYSEALSTPSKSSGTNSVAIAVPVTLFFVVLILVLGFLVYYRRRKRTQVRRNNSNETGTASPSKGIYEDPDRIYETLKQEEVPHNQEGTTTETYSHPDSNGIANQGSTEEEYTYAKTDVDTTHVEGSAPSISDDVYHTLEQPPSSDFYSYPDNNIPNPALTEQEYTYAKDTNMSKACINKKATLNERATSLSVNDRVYHSLEREEPVPTEQEYSYAKNTDIPSHTKQITQGVSDSPSNSDMYHTLEEPRKTQAAIYSTLEETEDVNNSQVVHETLKSNDPVYNVLEDSNTAH